MSALLFIFDERTRFPPAGIGVEFLTEQERANREGTLFIGVLLLLLTDSCPTEGPDESKLILRGFQENRAVVKGSRA